MTRLGMGLANAEAERESVTQTGVGQVEVTASVEPIQQLLVDGIPSPVPKTDQVQRCRRYKLEPVVLAHPRGEILSQLHMAPDVMAQALHAVVANDEPEL